jgi:hypothetical protein
VAERTLPSLRERAVIWKDIPVEQLGPDADKLLLSAKEGIVEFTNAKGEGSWKNTALYSPENKLEAAVMYSMSGSFITVAETMSLPIATVRLWSTQPWWPKAITLGRFYQSQKVHAKFVLLSEVVLERLTEALLNDNVRVATLVAALKVVGTESRETFKGMSGATAEDSTKAALADIQTKLKELSRAYDAKDVTPAKG